MCCATIEEAITVKYYVRNVVSIRVRDFQMQSDTPHKCFLADYVPWFDDKDEEALCRTRFRRCRFAVVNSAVFESKEPILFCWHDTNLILKD